METGVEGPTKGEPSAQPPSVALNIYFVRHAESLNNANKHHDEASDAALGQPSLDDVANSEAAAASPSKKRKTSEARRPDPGLTHRGFLQSKALAHFFSCLVEDPSTHGSLRPRRLFTSGFRRTLQTCQALAGLLGLEPELAVDVFEEGGVFHGPRGSRAARPADPTGEGPPAVHGLNASEMLQLLPRLKGADGVPDRGWWRGGVEAQEDTESRAQACAEWLWDLCRERTEPPTAGVANGRGAGAASAEEPGAIIVITHGLFLDRWLKALLGMPPMSDHALFLTANCAYWLLRLQLVPDGGAERRRTALMACNVVEHVPMHIRTDRKSVV